VADPEDSDGVDVDWYQSGASARLRILHLATHGIAMKHTILLLACLVATSTFAADRAATLKALMEAQGLVETFDQQKKAGKEYSEKQADAMLTQMFAGLNAPEEFSKKLHDAANVFIKESASPWSTQQIVDMWAEFYGKKFTDKELTELLKFYTSPLAQREVLAGREAMGELTKKLQADYAGTMQSATTNFIEAAKAIIQDCNCKK
jgi:hypothetical protein